MAWGRVSEFAWDYARSEIVNPGGFQIALVRGWLRDQIHAIDRYGKVFAARTCWHWRGEAEFDRVVEMCREIAREIEENR